MTKTAATAIKMLESLPEEFQEQVVERMRGLVEEVRDDARWAELLESHKKGLVSVAREAHKQIASGKAKEMDYDKL